MDSAALQDTDFLSKFLDPELTLQDAYTRIRGVKSGKPFLVENAGRKRNRRPAWHTIHTFPTPSYPARGGENGFENRTVTPTS